MSTRQGLLSCYLREWVDIIPMDKVLPCMDYRMRQAVHAPRKITWEDLSRSLSPCPSPLGLPLFINAMISTPGASDTVFESNGICCNFARGIRPSFSFYWTVRHTNTSKTQTTCCLLFEARLNLYSYINVLLRTIHFINTKHPSLKQCYLKLHNMEERKTRKMVELSHHQ